MGKYTRMMLTPTGLVKVPRAMQFIRDLRRDLQSYHIPKGMYVDTILYTYHSLYYNLLFYSYSYPLYASLKLNFLTSSKPHLISFKLIL